MEKPKHLGSHPGRRVLLSRLARRPSRNGCAGLSPDRVDHMFLPSDPNMRTFSETAVSPDMIRMSDVKVEFRAGGRGFTLLDIPNLSFRRGVTFGLSGPSGSGKSTLINLIAGLIRPTSGTICVDGVMISDLSQRRRDAFRAERIGIVFQNFNLIPALNARDNVALAMGFGGKEPPNQRAEKAAYLLDRVGLLKRMRHKPGALSHGEMQRVSIARAIANRPKLLLADEPTASLEPGLTAAIIDLLVSVARQDGATLLIASHDPLVLARMDELVELPTINRAGITS